VNKENTRNEKNMMNRVNIMNIENTMIREPTVTVIDGVSDTHRLREHAMDSETHQREEIYRKNELLKDRLYQ